MQKILHGQIFAGPFDTTKATVFITQAYNQHREDCTMILMPLQSNSN